MSLIYAEIPPKIMKVIEYDLVMRKYDTAVFEDEFQAYVSENVNEFGKKCASECIRAAERLKIAQRECWARLNAEFLPDHSTKDREENITFII